MIREYVRGREPLVAVFVLVAANLGVVDDDIAFMRQLDALGQPFNVVLTKADLLPPVQLARSYSALHRAASRHASFAGGDIPMCSSKNATGIFELWIRMRVGLGLTCTRSEEDETTGIG